MRFSAVFTVGAMLFASLSLAVSANATSPSPQVRSKGYAVSAGPTVIVGAKSVGAGSVVFPGEVLDLTDFQRWANHLSSASRSSTHVIRNQEEWLNAWRKTTTGQPPRDFKSGEMALAIFAGPKPTNGYSPGIISVKRNGEDLYVTYVLNKPRDAAAEGDRTTTSPWVIQMTPAASGRVRFISVTSAIE